MCPETRERGKRGREKENARRTFFFCLLSKCSIRLFFSPSVRVKKKVERGEELCSIVVTPFFLSAFYIYVRVFVFFTLSLFFFCIYTRIWRLQTYINARKDRKEGKNLYEAENEWKTHELVSALARSLAGARALSLSLNIDRSDGREGKRRASNYRKKYSRRRKKRNKVVWKCVLM